MSTAQMPDIMTLIDMKPLSYPTRFGIDPKQTKGAASADLHFQCADAGRIWRWTMSAFRSRRR